MTVDECPYTFYMRIRNRFRTISA